VIGPSDGTSLDLGHGEPVTEAERGRALVRLRDRYANDEVGLDDFSRALDGVFAATTVQELRAASPDSGLRAPASRPLWQESAALAKHLFPDETLMWIGRPEASVNVTPRGLLAAIPVIAFLIFWEAGAASGGAPIFFLLWGLVVAGGIAYQALGRTVVNARRTTYAVTTQRVLRLTRGRSGEQLDTITLRMIPGMSVTAGRNGRGTILFGIRTSDTSRSSAQVDDAAGVARLIGSLQARGTR
jgi:hypothetical protein